MNVSPFIREYMVRNQTGEDFLIHVAELVETQLKEWDESYEVFVMRLKDYEITVKNIDQYYHATLTDEEIRSLQKKAHFALDRQLWEVLKKKGLTINKGKGNYLEQVFKE